jgi:hypothetical protein
LTCGVVSSSSSTSCQARSHLPSFFALFVGLIALVIAWASTLEKAVEFSAFGCGVTAGILSLAAARAGPGAGPLNVVAAGLLCLAVALFVQYLFPASRLALVVFIILGIVALAATAVSVLSLWSLERHPVQEGVKEFVVTLWLAVLMSSLISAWLVFSIYLVSKLLSQATSA